MFQSLVWRLQIIFKIKLFRKDVVAEKKTTTRKQQLMGLLACRCWHICESCNRYPTKKKSSLKVVVSLLLPAIVIRCGVSVDTRFTQVKVVIVVKTLVGKLIRNLTVKICAHLLFHATRNETARRRGCDRFSLCLSCLLYLFNIVASAL